MLRKLASAALGLGLSVSLLASATGCDDYYGGGWGDDSWYYEPYEPEPYFDSPAYFNEYFDVFYD